MAERRLLGHAGLGWSGERWANAMTLVGQVADGLEPCWVAGLAVVLIVLGTQALPLAGEAFEWAQYLLLGTLFPALLLILSLVSRYELLPARVMGTVRLALALCGLIAAAAFLGRRLTPLLAGIIAVQSAVVLGRPRWSWLKKDTAAAVWEPGVIGRLLVLSLSWLVAVRFIWWTRLEAWTYRSILPLLILLVATPLVAAICMQSAKEEALPKRRALLIDILALAFLALASLRTDHLDWFHWGVIVGPAEMVRGGSWLLWDVPSQYGFLNTLLLSVLPTSDAWQALYLTGALLNFLVASFLFLLLRSLRPGAGQFLFALTVATAAVLEIPGSAAACTGPQVYPMVGAFRFFWSYALLAFLLWHSQRIEAQKPTAPILVLGCFAWLAGTLWSAESGVCCTAVWMPAYVIILLQRAWQTVLERGRLRAFAGVALWLALPVVLLACSAIAIAAYYRSFLGWGPDWPAFFEYVTAAQNGFFALPIDPQGVVWVLVLAGCLIATLACGLIAAGARMDQIALATGAFGAFWAVCSYFISRSHENNATCLTPMLFVGLALVFHLLRRGNLAAGHAGVLRSAAIPLFTILLVATFGNSKSFSLLRSGIAFDVVQRFPKADPSLSRFLATTPFQPGEPIVFLKSTGSLLPPLPADSSSVSRSQDCWLPFHPFTLFNPLPVERRKVYLTRFLAHFPADGWVLEDKRDPAAEPWFFDALSATHEPTRQFADENWQLRWLERKK